MPVKMKKGGTVFFATEMYFKKIDQRIKELELVKAYGQILTEMDAFLDGGLLDILMMVEGPSTKFIGELWKDKTLRGRKIAEILRRKGAIKKTLLAKISKFKGQRGTVVHATHHINALIKQDIYEQLKEIKNGMYNINQYEERRRIQALKEFENAKKLGKKVLAEIIKVQEKEYDERHNK